jgi:hypothetical protein
MRKKTKMKENSIRCRTKKTTKHEDEMRRRVKLPFSGNGKINRKTKRLIWFKIKSTKHPNVPQELQGGQTRKLFKQ